MSKDRFPPKLDNALDERYNKAVMAGRASAVAEAQRQGRLPDAELQEGWTRLDGQRRPGPVPGSKPIDLNARGQQPFNADTRVDRQPIREKKPDRFPT